MKRRRLSSAERSRNIALSVREHWRKKRATEKEPVVREFGLIGRADLLGENEHGIVHDTRIAETLSALAAGVGNREPAVRDAIIRAAAKPKTFVAWVRIHQNDLVPEFLHTARNGV